MLLADLSITTVFETIDWPNLGRMVVRMVTALGLGALLGLERAYSGKEAGIRTHMLVCLAAAILVMIPLGSGFDSADLSRVIQGILAGMGFIGGGVILKVTAEKDVIGLTTAAGIWLTTAIGIAVGLGRFGIAVVGTLFALITLRLWAVTDAKVKPHLPSSPEAIRQTNSQHRETESTSK